MDFSSCQGLLTTLVGLALFSLIAVGIPLLLMQSMQVRRERQNREINERLRTFDRGLQAARWLVHRDIVAGRWVETATPVVSLRDFIASRSR